MSRQVASVEELGEEMTGNHHADARMSGKKSRLRKVVVWSIVASFLAVAVASGGWVFAYVGGIKASFNAHATKIPASAAFPEGEFRPPASQDASINVLLLGSDSRGDATSVGDAIGSNQRTDTIIFVHIDADRNSAYFMSILRDSWVTIPGKGEAKINAAMAWGGTPLVVQTIESMLDSRIDHVAIVDFNGFAGMTNALHGIDVVSDLDFKHEQFTFHKGFNHLNGEQALGFVRERYSFDDGDYQRVRNQQLFLQALGTKALSRETLTSPEKISSFTTAISKYLSVDETLTPEVILGIGWSLRGVTMDDIDFFTLPTAGTGQSPDGTQSIVNVDELAVANLRAALSNDSVGEFLKERAAK